MRARQNVPWSQLPRTHTPVDVLLGVEVAKERDRADALVASADDRCPTARIAADDLIGRIREAYNEVKRRALIERAGAAW
jgi:hypothetical protein